MTLIKVVGLATTALVAMSAVPASAVGTLVADYNFVGNSLASTVAGAPNLVAVDPAGTNSFGTDTVLGVNRAIYNFTGSNFPTTNQGGLTLSNAGGLVAADNFSVDLVFKFNERTNAWRRILDTLNRTSDSGFYVDPSNNLDVFPNAGSAVSFNTGQYYDVVMVNDHGNITAYANGTSTSLAAVSTSLNISADNVIGLFIDNTVAGGQGEWSSGSIAHFGLYNGALSTDQIATIYHQNTTPGVPEPASWALMVVGFGLVGVAARRRSVAVAA